MSDTQGPKSILQAVQKAPLLSANASRLLEIAAAPDHELEDIIRVVKYDAAITARVLRTVNSVSYGLLTPVTSIERAVSYLGERMIISVALSDSIGTFLSKPMTGYQGEAGALWRHDLFCAFAAREISRHAKDDCDPELAFTAGLLHDIGKAVVTDFLEGTAEAILQRIEQGEVADYLAAEKDSLGLHHAEIGYALACHWQLPPSLQSAIRFHHTPAEAPEDWRALVYSVHLGDILSMMQGVDTGSDGMQYHLDAAYTEHFDLGPNELAAILLEAQGGYQKAQSALSGAEEDQG